MFGTLRLSQLINNALERYLHDAHGQIEDPQDRESLQPRATLIALVSDHLNREPVDALVASRIAARAYANRNFAGSFAAEAVMRFLADDSEEAILDRLSVADRNASISSRGQIVPL